MNIEKFRSDSVTQSWLVTIFFYALLLAILYLAFLVLSPFLKAIAWAAILAIIVYPAYAWLLKLLRGRATLAALAMTGLLILLIVVPVFRLVGFLSQEAVELASTIRALANGDEVVLWQQKPWVQSLLGLWARLSDLLASLRIDLRQAVVQGAQLASGFLVSQVKEIAQNVFLFVLNLVIALFTFFYFLRDGKELCERVRSVLPMDPKHQRLLFDSVVTSVFGVVHGCLITAIVQGALAGVAYWALGLPFAVLLGLATAFTALFPVGGSAVVWLPAAIYLLVQGAYIQGLILLIWGAGIVASIDNFLKPLFIGTRLRLPFLFLFFSILGGMRLFGVVGLILGPVLFALLVALLDLYMKEYAKA